MGLRIVTYTIRLMNGNEQRAASLLCRTRCGGGGGGVPIHQPSAGVTVSVTQRSPTHLVRGFVPREAKKYCFRHTFTKCAVLVFTLISREANHKNFNSRLRQIPGSYSFLEILYNNKILITNYQSFSHDHYA